MRKRMARRLRKPDLKRVAVLVDTSTTWGRGIIAGIHQYSRRHGNWHFLWKRAGWMIPRRCRAAGRAMASSRESPRRRWRANCAGGGFR